MAESTPPVAGRTVLYGGSFNPPHMGHQMACLYLLEAVGAKCVWLIPTFVHPFAKPLASFEHRLEMCRLMARPFGERVRVDPVERALGGQGRTYDTLVHLRAEHPKRALALAIGADILEETVSWHRWEDIEAMVPVVVIGRQGYPTTGKAPVALPALSSTEIRQRLAAGTSVEGCVPAAVAHYVSAHCLYGDPAT